MLDHVAFESVASAIFSSSVRGLTVLLRFKLQSPFGSDGDVAAEIYSFE